MNSSYWVSLSETQPIFQSDLGSIQVVETAHLPILSRLSIKRVVLAPGAIREPQWNVNANQIAYVTSGEVLVSMPADGNEFASFVAGEGQMYHVESGAVYHIENVSAVDAEIIIALRHESPLHFSLRDSLAAMTNPVLGNTICPVPPSPPSNGHRRSRSSPVAAVSRATSRRSSRTPTFSTWRVSTRRCRTRTARHAWHGGSTGPPLTTSRCTRCVSRRTGCAPRTGTR
ncbi:cupin domain-containing protein [Streptomyces pinistramenti]|uniref:cupin domain-containing protein n=1 Tax=Streptomyces pinistramenti TaxID=2884812 RepID=UPI001D061701|nr:cupin domain-containing protein [Streptomyces pinistramenti]MCB5906157.1 cupin domain-containing protein [Streptomyces pinistramenti]